MDPSSTMSRRCGMTASRTAAKHRGSLRTQRTARSPVMRYPHLFEPYERDGMVLPHRVAMAPLTRNRARATIPGELNATYYAQRASAAILVTEGTHPDPVGQGYLDIAGLHDDTQQDGWAQVASAVHAAGDARLVIQLMHCGRVAHP